MYKLLEMKEKIMNFIHKILALFVKKYRRLCEWYREYENKRALIGAVSAWLVVFIAIIIVCRITNVSKVSVSANETTTIEVESTYETTEKAKSIAKETSSNQSESQQEVTEQTTAEAKENAEKETVDVSKLSVSTTPIADDSEMTSNKFTSINSADIKTVSSTNYAKSQFSYGIDISYHQGKIDWAQVKASGVEYAFIRVGNRGYETGKLCKDARFDENVRGAIANGIKVGVYFFSQAVTEQEALEEASLTLEYIKNYDITLPVVIDWETDASYRTYSGLSKTGLTNILTTFCDTVERYGYDSMVYMCKDDYVNRINTTSITSKYKTWVAWYFKEYSSANYASNIFHYGDLLPDMTFNYYMWQYSSKGRINGISELVDMNIMIVPKTVYDVKINASKSTFTVNSGSAVNLLEGVSASDSDGNDAASRISMTITNANGKQVSEGSAFAASGTYKVLYSFKDTNGTIVSTESVLYVRNAPEVYFEKILWSDGSKKQITYEYNTDLSVTDNYNEIIQMVKEKVSSCYYDTVAGSSTKHEINNASYSSFDKIIVNGDIPAQSVDITYTAEDGKGLTTAKTIILKINRIAEAESEETSARKETNIS